MTKNNSLGTFGIVVTAVFGSLLLFLLLSSFGAFKTFLSWDARQAGLGWKLLGILPAIVLAYLVRQLAKDNIEFTRGVAVSILVCLAFWISGNAGFRLTGGDIKQRVTAFNLDGKVIDKKVLYEYYDYYYGFSKDTALKNYVEKYGELPGRNNWSYNIRVHKTDSSKAPRANEDFPWHSGAYQDLYK